MLGYPLSSATWIANMFRENNVSSRQILGQIQWFALFYTDTPQFTEGLHSDKPFINWKYHNSKIHLIHLTYWTWFCLAYLKWASNAYFCQQLGLIILHEDYFIIKCLIFHVIYYVICFCTIKSNHLMLGTIWIRICLREKESRISGDIGGEPNEKCPMKGAAAYMLTWKKTMIFWQDLEDDRGFIFLNLLFLYISYWNVFSFLMGIQIS